MNRVSFEELQLAAPLLRALTALNYTTATPIQGQAIPPQLQGRDLLGCAQTGTGKTAAFALPILHHLECNPKPRRPRLPRVLVLTPTRELAVQVGDSFRRYGTHMNLRHCLVYGGVGRYPQIAKLARGVDILVATPGRLLDLMQEGAVRLDSVEFLVLDEVDRMLDMGFIHDVRKIAGQLPKNRQTSLFSATLTKEVTELAHDFVKDPVLIRIDPDRPVVDRIRQQVCHVRGSDKLQLLEHFLRANRDEPQPQIRTLVFSRTKFGAQRLSEKLCRLGFRSESIHGNKSQSARQKALEQFRNGRTPVLVATDVASRGIDVKDIALVVNYDLPDAADTYVHRIGRTARAEAHGRAVTFCEGRDIADFAQIERHLGGSVEVDLEHPFHDSDAIFSRPAAKRTRNRKRPGHPSKTPRFRRRKGHVAHSA